MCASSTVFWPFFELHLEHAATYVNEQVRLYNFNDLSKNLANHVPDFAKSILHLEKWG